MTSRFPFAAVLFCALLVSACGYRFVRPVPHCSCALEEVRNATSESGLHLVLEKALREMGTFSADSTGGLFVAVTGFEESLGSVDSEGVPVRQKLVMEVSWIVRGDDPSGTGSGREEVSLSYPSSAEAVRLDWNRSAAIRLLAEEAARKILERVETVAR